MFYKQISISLLVVILFAVFCRDPVSPVTGTITVKNNADVTFQYTVTPSG